MKKFILPLLALIALSVFPSCSEKFNVAAPYKNITVIYGLLDRADTAHYVRVQKAFLDDNKSALTMAKTADSSFFNNINVRIKRISIHDTSVFDTIHLNRVDLNTEGYPKQSGAFFDAPNYAYKFTNDLDPNYIYRIIVNNSATGEVDSADAPVIDDKNKSVFQLFIIDDTTANAPTMEFTSTQPNSKVNFSGLYTAPSDFYFEGRNSPVAITQAVLRFNWSDSNISTGVKTKKYYDFDLGYGEVSGTSNISYINFAVKDLDIYNAINVGLGKPADNFTVRLMDRCQLSVYLGTAAFSTYINVQALQGTGLTGNEIQPTFTNIKGKNVLGLYTSKAMRSGPVTMSSKSIAALQVSSLVSQCRIVGTVYH